MSNGGHNSVENLLHGALADAGVYEDTALLLLVAGAPPPGASEYAYLPPGHWGDLENRVLRDAGERLADFSLLHRFGAYAEPGDITDVPIAVGLRHEAQHAVQFNEHGRGLFDLESVLRRAMRRTGRMDDYTLIPTERDANRAAGAYARARFPDHIEALAADERFRHFVEEPPVVVNLLDETVEMIWQYADGDELDDQDGQQRPFRVVVPELKQAVLDWTPIDPQYRPRRSDEEPFVVEVEQAR